MTTLFTNYLTTIKSNIKEISVDELASKITSNQTPSSPFHVVDVREMSEWESGHIPSAKYTGRGLLEKNIESVVPNTSEQVILYCGSGVRSAFATDTLQRMGYTNVCIL